MVRMAAVVRLIAAVLAMAVVLPLAGAAAETHHVVGGWGPELDVGAWLWGRVFRVGDKLWFKHSGREESIVEVDRPEEFETCNVTNPIRMFTDRVDLESEGLRYFASGDPESCRNGLKLPVSVRPHHPAREDDFDTPPPWHHIPPPPPPFDPFGPSDWPPPEPLHPPPEHKPPPPFEPPEPFHPPPKSPPLPPFEPFGPPPFVPPPRSPPPPSPPFEPSGPPPFEPAPEPVRPVRPPPPPPPHHPPKSPPPPPPAPAHHPPPPPPPPPHPSPAHINGPSIVNLMCYLSVMFLGV